MQLKLIKQEQLSEHLQRWYFRLPPSDFAEFGFFLDSLEGMAQHHKHAAAKDVMEVDVPLGWAAELEYLLSLNSSK